MQQQSHDCDVLILGAGLAGLTLARQLLLADPDLRILQLERRHEIPRSQQKVGEATVQVSGYYLGRVLQLEEHLLRHHFLKYNLRFFWKTTSGGQRYEEYSQSYIRGMSNIPTYQLDRNVLESELIRVNREQPRYRLISPAKDLEIDLAKGGDLHGFQFLAEDGPVSGRACWVVDASGRSRILARKLGLVRQSPIDHGTSFLWVDGLLDVEKLTDLTAAEIRKRPDRASVGHMPAFLATNHFCGEGFWFWVIPLHGITSLGLVYDASKISRADVGTPEKLVAWICREFPCFARDLPRRKIVSRGGFDSFALDSSQTLSADGWAMCGEACRFTDPLYSPGGDLIAIYNTVITDAILTRDRGELEGKVRMYEGLARAVYEAYIPSYAVSYETLGDQETFSLRYTWELAIYFSFYVFPFINDLFTDRRFLPGYLRRFSQLGPMNRRMHELLVAFYRWKKENLSERPDAPILFDFYEAWQLGAAEKCFYKVGVPVEEARRVLDEQLGNLEEMARWTTAHIAATVLGDPRALTHPDFVGSLDPAMVEWDPDGWRALLERCHETAETWPWRHAPIPSDRFRPMRMEEMEGEREIELQAAAGGMR